MSLGSKFNVVSLFGAVVFGRNWAFQLQIELVVVVLVACKFGIFGDMIWAHSFAMRVP